MILYYSILYDHMLYYIILKSIGHLTLPVKVLQGHSGKHLIFNKATST